MCAFEADHGLSHSSDFQFDLSELTVVDGDLRGLTDLALKALVQLINQINKDG